MRALLLVLDSIGIGAAPDAAKYGDEGSDTLGHLLARYPELELPALWSMGLGRILGQANDAPVQASYGRMRERSAGKDSMTGHWELAGVIIEKPFAVFESFPAKLVSAIEAECGVQFLGNCAASGTEIIEQLGAAHLGSGRPILYTSADSVLQIAAHEAIIPCESLYEICRIARRHADDYRIGRVIARPFIGGPGAFVRTERRHDFPMRPPRTVLDGIVESGFPVKAIGKITDLFAGKGFTELHPTASNEQGMRSIKAIWDETDVGLVFANLVDFDTLYGHRRDFAGYARALADFDRWLEEFMAGWREEDLLMITADHGNDPTFRGTDHTREEVPVMVRYQGRADALGCRATFADVAATLSAFFELKPAWPIGAALIDVSSPRLQSTHPLPNHIIPVDPTCRVAPGR